MNAPRPLPAWGRWEGGRRQLHGVQAGAAQMGCAAAQAGSPRSGRAGQPGRAPGGAGRAGGGTGSAGAAGRARSQAAGRQRGAAGGRHVRAGYAHGRHPGAPPAAAPPAAQPAAGTCALCPLAGLPPVAAAPCSERPAPGSARLLRGPPGAAMVALAACSPSAAGAWPKPGPLVAGPLPAGVTTARAGWGCLRRPSLPAQRTQRRPAVEAAQQAASVALGCAEAERGTDPGARRGPPSCGGPPPLAASAARVCACVQGGRGLSSFGQRRLGRGPGRDQFSAAVRDALEGGGKWLHDKFDGSDQRPLRRGPASKQGTKLCAPALAALGCAMRAGMPGARGAAALSPQEHTPPCPSHSGHPWAPRLPPAPTRGRPALTPCGQRGQRWRWRWQGKG